MSTPTISDLARAQGHCASCYAPILWAETSRGKRMPVDPTPTAVGNIKLHIGYDTNQWPRLCCNVIAGHELGPLRAAGTPLRTAHFTTCPHDLPACRPTADEPPMRTLIPKITAVFDSECGTCLAPIEQGDEIGLLDGGWSCDTCVAETDEQED